MAHASYDFQTIKGNSLDIRLRLKPLDGTGSRFTFRCASSASDRVVLQKSTDDGSMEMHVTADVEDSSLSVTSLYLRLSPEETRRLGDGRVNPYEVERQSAGEEITLLAGHIIASRGVNVDG